MRLFVFTLLLCCVNVAFGQEEGYHIEIQLDGYENDTLFLAYYHGDKQYMQDTTYRKGGRFIFSGEDPLDPGMYIVVRNSERTFFQLLIDYDEMHFSLQADNDEVAKTVRLRGAPQNEAFYEYMGFLQDQRKMGDEVREQLEGADEKEKDEIEAKLKKMDKAVKSYQLELMETFDGDLLGAIIRANMEPEVPDFEGPEEEVRQKRFKYYKTHFFDNVDLTDKRLLRSPILYNKVNQYIDQLTSKNPDSIARSIDYVLEQMEGNKTVYRFFLANFLNNYARSKIIGMDAVYVHLTDKYYSTGKAWWIGEEQLEKIVENADKIRPTLIGKIAPNITLEKRNGERVQLHHLDYEYTLLYFWRPDCGHCKRYTPLIVKFLEENKDKGIGVVTVCTKFTDDVPGCWDYLDNTEGTDLFLNLVDPFHRSRFTQHFNVKTTPLIYVLDRDKKILSKRLSAQQLPEVMPMLMGGEDSAGQFSDTDSGE
nr:DUF5106 domain-containing protein [Saprospiraceae bacterium]